MTHEELLDKVKNRSELEDCWMALQKVIELHKPNGEFCSVCCEMNGVCDCCTGFEKVCVDYPCPTIQAIEKELK